MGESGQRSVAAVCTRSQRAPGGQELTGGCREQTSYWKDWQSQLAGRRSWSLEQIRHSAKPRAHSKERTGHSMEWRGHSEEWSSHSREWMIHSGALVAHFRAQGLPSREVAELFRTWGGTMEGTYDALAGSDESCCGLH